MVHQEVSHNGEATNEEYIDYYCKQFAEFMLAHPQCKYNIKSSKKRSRELEKQEETVPQNIPLVPDKGKGRLNLDLARVKFPLNKEINSLEGHTKKEALVL